MHSAEQINNMSYDEVHENLRDARIILDDIITECFLLSCAAARYEGDNTPVDIHMTEFMTICAWQTFNDQGQRGGDVKILLRDGSMPMYVARGMIASAKEHIDRNNIIVCGCIEEDDSDGCS